MSLLGTELFTILSGCCTIQIWRKVGGVNWHPHTLELEVCSNTLVDESDFHWLHNQGKYQWFISLDPASKDYYVYRRGILPSGKRVKIYMAREILCLPRGAGRNTYKADHKDHDAKNNTKNNLRIATPSQSAANTGRIGGRSRFKGVMLQGFGFLTRIRYKYQRVCFQTVYVEVEAALMYNYAVIRLQGEFAKSNIILEEEMPTPERQKELYEMVITKLRQIGLISEGN